MKKYKIFFWISTVFLFLFEGLMPLSTLLFMPQYMTVGTRPLGYPDYFAVALSLCKVLGVLALVIPKIPNRLKEWAYAGLTFNLIFACISHLAVNGVVGVSFFPLIILGILAVSYICHHKIQATGQDGL